MRVLVTGVEGQLARSLVERAAHLSAMNLVAVGRPELDLEMPGTAAAAIAASSADVVINAAAYTAVDQAEDEPERAFRINAEAAGEIAAAADRIGARLIQISTDYVFDGRRTEPYREHDLTNPLGVYGRSKLEGEKRVSDATADHLIIRTAWVYSPWGRNFVRTMMSAATERDVLTVVNDQRGNPSSALDLADGLLAALSVWGKGHRTGLGGTYHLGGTGATSWCGLAQAIMAECSRNGLPTADVQPIPTADRPTRAARPTNSTLDCTKFASDFGFAMPDWRTSLRSVVERLAAGGA